MRGRVETGTAVEGIGYGDPAIFAGYVVVVVDLYIASRSASNALIVPLRRKKMSFQRRSEAVGTPSRTPEVRVEASSIPSDPQRRKPDDQTCCDGVVESSTGDGCNVQPMSLVVKQLGQAAIELPLVGLR